MPPAEFDEFTKALAAAPSRRAVLRLLTSGAAAFVAGRALGSFPEQAMASSSACKDSNELSTTCEGLLKYVYDCGVFCPNREHHRGKGGCTVPNARGKLPLSTTTYKRNGQGGWCASKTVNATFTVNPKVTVLSWSPSRPACCPNECVAAVRDVLKQVADHEQEHVKIIKDEAGAATKAWTNRTFTRCATTKKAAKLQLDVEIETAFQRQRINLETKFAQE